MRKIKTEAKAQPALKAAARIEIEADRKIGLKSAQHATSHEVNGGETCLSQSEVEAHLVKAGLQVTAQRIAIARYVLCEAEHPTALDVKAWTDLNFPKLSLATVYNTLNILVKAGLLRELRLPHTDKAIYDDNLKQHHHFFDEKTGRLYDLTSDECEVHVKLKKELLGAKMSDVQVFIRGQKA